MAFVYCDRYRLELFDLSGERNPRTDGSLLQHPWCRTSGNLGFKTIVFSVVSHRETFADRSEDKCQVDWWFCGLNVIHVSRLPFEQTGKANWTALLAVLHKRQLLAARTPPFEPALVDKKEGVYVVEIEGVPNVPTESPSWSSLHTRPLVRHGSTACTVVSRATLITLLSLTNARCTFRRSGAAGHRQHTHLTADSGTSNGPLAPRLWCTLPPTIRMPLPPTSILRHFKDVLISASK